MPDLQSEERLRAAVIGTGKIAAEHLGFLGRSPRADLVAVCDLREPLAVYSAERFGAARWFTSYKQMLEEVRPEVVHVLTPAHTHVEVATSCLDAGAHVIVEKPVATSQAELEELWSRAERAGRRLVEDHNYRFNEPVLAIEDLLARGVLGEVRDVEVVLALGVREPGNRYADPHLPHPSHRLPAGVIHEFVTHLCYLVDRFAPELARAPRDPRVEAVWSNHGGGGIFRFDDLDALVVGETRHARIRFSSEARPEGFWLTVRGTRGTARTELFLPFLEVDTGRADAPLSSLRCQLANGWRRMTAAPANLLAKIRQKTPYEGLATFLDRTYAALRRGQEPPVTRADMEAALRLTELLLDRRP